MKLRIDPTGVVFLLIFLWMSGQYAAQEASAGIEEDPRFCGAPVRDAAGRIVRSSIALREFERVHPKPLDGRRWYRDHVLPLACGGCDALINLQWLPEDQWLAKSKWERKVYGGNNISEGCP